MGSSLPGWNFRYGQPFSDDVHCLEPADGPPRRFETVEAESGIDSAFDESVVLLEDIIEAI